MIEVLISLAVLALVCAVLYWAGHRLAVAFGTPAQIVTIFDVVLIVAFVIGALRILGLWNRLGL